MSYEVERDDIATYLSANWTTTTIKYPNRKFKQPKDTIWLKMNIVTGEGLQTSFGTVQDHEFLGDILLTFFAPKDSGTNTVNQYADTLFDLFVNKTIGSVHTYTPNMIHLGEVENWYQVVLTIPFTRDKIVTIT